MLLLLRKVINFGTDDTTMEAYQKHSIRLVNGLSILIIIAKVAGELITYCIGDTTLLLKTLLGTLFANSGFALVLYLNSKRKFIYAKWIFTILLVLIMVTIPFMVPHNVNGDGIFLVVILIFAAIFNETKTILMLTLLISLLLIGWHLMDHYSILQVEEVEGEKMLYIEIHYTILTVAILLIALFSVKRTTSDYQRELTRNLQEKDLLIKEIHHRVKNNLQVIVSMLRIEQDNVKSKEALEVINNIKARVTSMTLVHNKLYQDHGYHGTNIQEYLTELSTLLIEMSSYKNGSIRKIIEVEDLNIGLELSIPVGLIATEIISNSVKHAFAPDHTAVIEITGKKISDTKYQLEIKDNGKGIDPTVSIKENMGFLLINILSKQINGQIERINDQGLVTKIIFPI